MKTFLCVALSCLLVSLVQADDPTVQQINIAYVEGKPLTAAPSGKSLIVANIDEYVKVIKAKNSKNIQLDIVVLPEYGLTGKNLDKKFALSINQSDAANSVDMNYLNTVAKDNKWTLVANLIEKDEDDLYSTTIVLDGNDTLVAKYRKINLNEETEGNLKSSDETVTFKRENLGTFGLLSGEDILYEEQIRNLMDQNVTTIIHTSSMKSVGPFGAAPSLHAGLAKALGINVVVASLNNNETSGSGVYTPCDSTTYINADEQGGVGIKTIDATANTKCSDSVDQVLHKGLRGVLGLGTNKPLDQLLTYDYTDLVTELVNASITDQEKCDGSFCCNFTLSSTDFKKETYRLAVLGGDKKVCAFMWCAESGEDKINTCGKIDKKASANFDSIKIVVTSEESNLFIPYILHSDLTPAADIKTVTFEAKDKKATFSINKITDAIAIGLVTTKSGASSLQIMAMNVIVFSVILKYFF